MCVKNTCQAIQQVYIFPHALSSKKDKVEHRRQNMSMKSGLAAW